jgi:hypothetical protein
MSKIIEYAGFRYHFTEDGHVYPVAGQHPAAEKQRHVMAARAQELARQQARKQQQASKPKTTQWE